MITDEYVVSAIGLQLEATGVASAVLWGRSMFPSIWPGTRVTIQACALDELEVGDIAAIRSGGGLTVHRVVSRANGVIRVQGELWPQPDPIDVTPEDVLGRVSSLPLGPVAINAPRWLVSRTNRLMARSQRALRSAWPSAAWLLRATERLALDASSSVRASRIGAPPRPLTERDLPALRAALLRRGTRPTARELAAWQQMARPPHRLPAALIIRPERGEIVSFARVERLDADTAGVFDIHTARWARRLGLASQILEASVLHAARCGARRVVLDSRPERARLYLRCGFVASAEPSVSPGFQRYERAAPVV